MEGLGTSFIESNYGIDTVCSNFIRIVHWYSTFPPFGDWQYGLITGAQFGQLVEHCF